MSESEAKKLIEEMQAVIGDQVIKHVNKAGNQRVGAVSVLIIGCTAWLTSMFSTAQATIAKLSDLHRDAVRVSPFLDWVETTADKNINWIPAKFRHAGTTLDGS
jgi:hypothetical protein